MTEVLTLDANLDLVIINDVTNPMFVLIIFASIFFVVIYPVVFLFVLPIAFLKKSKAQGSE